LDNRRVGGSTMVVYALMRLGSVWV